MIKKSYSDVSFLSFFSESLCNVLCCRLHRIHFQPFTCVRTPVRVNQLFLLQIQWAPDYENKGEQLSIRRELVIINCTQMMLPIRDILAVQNSKAARFGHHGLIVIVKGYEELFFEFGFEDRRSAFVNLLERQMEVVKGRVAAGEVPITSQGKRDAMLLEQFDAKTTDSTESDRPAPETMADSLPAIMFTSVSSTFLTFKPKESLHFTFLTIGSRGDVQPYIALAKPLMADGHRVKIATHGEFKEWIESVSGRLISVLERLMDTQYGIEYGYVGGDPAELMRICVENGTFTFAFMKESLLKVCAYAISKILS